MHFSRMGILAIEHYLPNVKCTMAVRQDCREQRYPDQAKGASATMIVDRHALCEGCNVWSGLAPAKP